MTFTLMQKGLENLIGKEQMEQTNEKIFGEKVGLAASFFGCWHSNITRPFMEGKTFYRTCLKCGARRNFNPETRKNEGQFYYPPVGKIG